MLDGFTDQIVATMLVSLRLAPTFAFAPPFTFLRTPASVRLALILGLGFWLNAVHPVAPIAREALLDMMASELLLGMTLAISLQLAFAALLMAGRTIDVQVGFGLAQVADPTLRAQMPLVGTLFVYGAAAIFFATSGPNDLLVIWARSLEVLPLGAFTGIDDLSTLLSYLSTIFATALGVAGLVMLTIFLVDLGVAFLSRTLPQMNALVLGFQVKAIVLLVTLPFVFAFSGAAFLRIVRLAVNTAPQLI